MILTGNSIIDNHSDGSIKIEPFDISLVNPNSYDVRLGNKLRIYQDEILDTKKINSYDEIIIPESGYVLEKKCFYLGHTCESIGSNKYVPILHNKSGIARLGLFIHITADLIDLGFLGNLTLQLFPTLNIKVYPNMRIAQISFWQTLGETNIQYNGKYQNSLGPVSSKNYLNFTDGEIK